MQFREVLALRGPNIWANSPTMEAWVDLGELKDRASNTIPGFNDRLMSWLPTMIEHECSEGHRGGFFERLREGTYPAHILEHVTLELQTRCGVEIGFGRARESSEEGVYKVVFKYREETLARECLAAARELILAAMDDRPFDVKGTLDRLRDVAERYLLGPSTNAIVQAARERGIPVYRLARNSLVQFGYGVRQRRIQAADTDRTSAIAESIAQDKELTRKLLRAAGVPTPHGRPAVDAEDAWAAAQEIGLPVVVKPQDGNQGRGVATNLTSRAQVLAAYEAARKESEDVVVEKHAYGHDYRLLVVGEKLVAASRREPAHVVGDGTRTINQLIEIANTDPRRGEHHANVLSKIKIDAVALGVLADQGFTPESVPPAGQTVLIRRNANLSTGGTAIDVTDRVHPAVAARAVDAAKMIGLDIAGIDVVAQDISTPLEEQGGVIVEVNATPGLRMHLAPSAGLPRPVGQAIIDMMFAPGENGRIPIVAVSGVNGKTTVTRFIAHLLRGTGRRVGLTCSDGTYVEDRRTDPEDCSNPMTARNVLLNPNVEAAVFEAAGRGILRAGLGFDQCDVAVVTNIGRGDHLGLSDIHTPEDLVKVKRTIVDVTTRGTGTAVLNAADPLVAGMALAARGSVLFFARDGSHPVIVQHRNSGGRALFVRDHLLIRAEGAREEPLLSLDRIPLTFGGRVRFGVENALAALAAAWALGVPTETLVARAETFTPDMSKVPGRFNVLEIKGATVVIDNAHNGDALQALIEALGLFPHACRRVVFSTTGDRRDGDMVAMGRQLGDAFDHVILYEDASTRARGRAEGEIIRLFRQGLASGSRVRQTEEVAGAVKALEHALNAAQPGDLVVLQTHVVDETVEFVRRYVNALAAPSQAAEVEAIAAALAVHGSLQEELKVPTKPSKPHPPADVCAGVLAEAPIGSKAS